MNEAQTSKRMKDTSRKLPDGWRWVRLGDVISETQAGFACGERDPEGIVQLRMNNVDTRGNFVWNDVIRIPREGNNIEPFLLAPGDVLFNNTNSTELVGKSALFNGFDEPIVYSNHFTRLRTIRDDLLPDILASWLNHQWQQGVFAAICNSWIGQSAVKADRLLNLEIPLPPITEQRRIAGILNEQMAALDKARAAAQARLEAVKALPAAFLRQVFLKPGQPLSDGWRWVPLGDVLILRKDIVHPHDNPEGSSVFVGLEHIEPNTGRRLGSAKVEMSELTGRKPMFFKDDIVYGYLRPYLNKVWVAEFDGLCSVDQYVYSVNSQETVSSYVAWYMRSPLFIDNSPVGKTPGWLPRIRTEEVASVRIPLPPLALQQEIAQVLAEQMLSLENARAAAEAELDAINTLPAALLRRAFGGEL